MSQKVIDEKGDEEEASQEASAEVEPEHKMTIWEHLEELRSRFVKAMAMIFITSIGAWYFRVKILAWLLKQHPLARFPTAKTRARQLHKRR